MKHWTKRPFCQNLKRWFNNWITGQNVQRLQFFTNFASYISGILNVQVDLQNKESGYNLPKSVWRPCIIMYNLFIALFITLFYFRHICKICFKGFKYNTDYKNHLIRHRSKYTWAASHEKLPKVLHRFHIFWYATNFLDFFLL